MHNVCLNEGGLESCLHRPYLKAMYLVKFLVLEFSGATTAINTSAFHGTKAHKAILQQ